MSRKQTWNWVTRVKPMHKTFRMTAKYKNTTMKKTLFLFLLLISIHTLGQEHLIGVQSGLNLTNITDNAFFDNSKTRTGFIGGINYTFKISDRYQIGVDALYAQQGYISKFIAIEEYGPQTGVEDSKFNHDYFSLPLKIGYEMGEKIKIIPRIGLVPSFLIKAESIIPRFDDSGNVTGHETVNARYAISKFDFGGLLELGFESRLTGNLFFCPALTYRHSLSTFSNSNYFEDSKMRHYGLSIAVGIKYQLKTR